MSASPFVADWSARLAPREGSVRRALDLAMGRGRHAVVLARHGFRTYGVDERLDAVREAVTVAARERLTVRGWCADVTMFPLPPEAFDLMVVTRYLQRDLWPSIRRAVTPGGCVIYETFTVLQRALGTGPTSDDHLLECGELRASFPEWDVLFDEEVAAPEAVARLVARKPRVSRPP